MIYIITYVCVYVYIYVIYIYVIHIYVSYIRIYLCWDDISLET